MGAFLSAHGEHEFQELSDKTGFSLDQITHLHKRFRVLSQNEDTLRKDNFIKIPDLACNPIRAQIIEAFFDKRNYRQNSAGKVEEIGFEEFITVLSHFKPPELNMTDEKKEALRKEKLRFLFNMHDTDNDGTITLEEYKHVVEELLSRCGQMEIETAKAIANSAMLDVANITMGQMAPDEFFEGITFDHFLKILKGFEIEMRMHIRFLNPANLNCRKSHGFKLHRSEDRSSERHSGTCHVSGRAQPTLLKDEERTKQDVFCDHGFVSPPAKLPILQAAGWVLA
ncbi:hypothetical protein SKAU_G00009290 [Synaphobranchus kaupii]|uniref:Calcineurin B homologous protein 3 n=1 Tax=Synaphobranchus kaupii TaxID=118154 RepID=A0A9Q1GAX3_SYNKA|nr:hypothetical protein SKAU_G00009290 [Synaphobranchus kaupii]